MVLSADSISKSVAYMDPALLAREPELVATKWPEYRGLSPFACDLLFAQTYRECYKDMVRTHVDYAMVDAVKGIDLRLWESPEISVADPAGVRQAVHRARQHADEWGMPYPDFIWFCMDFASNRSCRNIVRPNQLIPKNPETLSGKQMEFKRKKERIWKCFWQEFAKFREQLSTPEQKPAIRRRKTRPPLLQLDDAGERGQRPVSRAHRRLAGDWPLWPARANPGGCGLLGLR